MGCFNRTDRKLSHRSNTILENVDEQTFAHHPDLDEFIDLIDFEDQTDESDPIAWMDSQDNDEDEEFEEDFYDDLADDLDPDEDYFADDDEEDYAELVPDYDADGEPW